MIMVGTAFQSIGLGFPSVPGAAVARPESTIVLTTGDGGGLMALADLESAVRVAGGRGIAVVWNDAAYGAEVNLYGLKGLAEAPMLIPETDFAGLAAAFGAEGVVVRELADLDRLASGRAGRPPSAGSCCSTAASRARSSRPYQQEIIRGEQLTRTSRERADAPAGTLGADIRSLHRSLARTLGSHMRSGGAFPPFSGRSHRMLAGMHPVDGAESAAYAARATSPR